jgi:pyruvate formate lyase activating enzyme
MEAYLYRKWDDRKVICNLCHHRCSIRDGKRGICGVRENRSGVLYTLVFGKLIARHIDPIEKKPLYHFLPGSLSYSVATVGCNFKCRFCQNADIAQMPGDQNGMILGDPYSPKNVVDSAIRGKCKSISYTYTEPTIFYEFAYETARLAADKGLKNVFVTNGYMTEEALEKIYPYLDAANVDLKAFTDEYYRDLCGAKLGYVKDTLVRMHNKGIFLEVTTLIVPGLNDSPHELEELANFLVGELGSDTPWHISRFHPTYKLVDRPPTPLSSLLRARDIGLKAGLRYVYTGNVPGEGGENTYCQDCGKLLIERLGFQIANKRIENGSCPFCGAGIAGIDL